MKAVILAAREKESLYPLSDSKPLGLMPVSGTPLVERLLGQLEELGIDDIDIVVNHLGEMYEEHFSENNSVNIVRQEKTSGTADALESVGGKDDTFIVVNGDVVLDLEDLEKLVESHDSFATVLATDEDRPEKFGVLGIRDDQVVEITEKPEEPESPLVNTGIYVFEPEIFSLIDGEKSLVEVLEKAVDQEDVRYELAEKYWIDIGSFRKLKEADRKVRATEKDFVSDDAEVSGNAVVENSVVREGASIDAGAVIRDSYIGENTVIGPNTVVEDSTVSYECFLEQCSVRNSIIFEENILDPFVALEESVLAEECDVKQGTVIRESYIGSDSFVEVNNSIYGTKFVPGARTDLGEISK